MRIFFISAWKFPQNRPYGRLENKSQEIKKVIKPYNISSDHNELKLKIYNIKKKTWKICTYMETEQYVPKCTVDHRGNQTANQKIPGNK